MASWDLRRDDEVGGDAGVGNNGGVGCDDRHPSWAEDWVLHDA